jgi:hypothetical protein
MKWKQYLDGWIWYIENKKIKRKPRFAAVVGIDLDPHPLSPPPPANIGTQKEEWLREGKDDSHYACVSWQEIKSGAPIPPTAKRVGFFINSCIPVVHRMQTDVDGVRERWQDIHPRQLKRERRKISFCGADWWMENTNTSL